MKIDVRLKSQLTVPPKENPLFGTVFSDHMFRAEFRRGVGWRNPVIQPYGPMSLDPACSALHYGQSMFEGLKAYRLQDGRVSLFRPDFHIRRMIAGAEALCLEPPPEDLFREGLMELVRTDAAWVPKGEGAALYIRPTLFASEPFLGVRPADQVTFFIITSPVGSYYKTQGEPLRIWVERHYVRAAPGGLGAVKASANYVAALKASVEAKQRGYHQVLWTDAVEHEWIEEVGTMNVFFRFRDEIVTPALDGTILGGCTRDSVLHLLRSWGLRVEERRVSWHEVQKRHAAGELLEVFGSGTAATISPIGELGHGGGSLTLPVEGEVASRLLNELRAIQSGEKPSDWMVAI